MQVSKRKIKIMMGQLVSKTAMQKDEHEGRVAMRGHKQMEGLGC
jgi:hypothetical protein